MVVFKDYVPDPPVLQCPSRAFQHLAFKPLDIKFQDGYVLLRQVVVKRFQRYRDCTNIRTLGGCNPRDPIIRAEVRGHHEFANTDPIAKRHPMEFGTGHGETLLGSGDVLLHQGE
jgi:hypothetical protein